MDDTGLDQVLAYFESVEVDLNAYFVEPEIQSVLHSELRANSRILGFHLRRLGLDDLNQELDQLDVDRVGVVELLSTMRGLVIPELRKALAATSVAYSRSDADLLADIESEKQLMIAVATGGPRIAEVNDEYRSRRAQIAQDLMERGIEDPNPFPDLWKWYGKWSSELQGYQPRREYIVDLFAETIRAIGNAPSSARAAEPTGWQRVDRTAGKIRAQLMHAQHQEDFQGVGLLCRDVLVSLAQEVFDRAKHPSPDNVEPSDTDSRRMLDAYISTELHGGENEAVRRHAKAALALANALTHKRTATYREAALCAEATLSVIAIIAIVSGRRGG